MEPKLVCYVCDNEIRPHDRYFDYDSFAICESCIDFNMHEFDPEGDLADEAYDERVSEIR